MSDIYEILETMADGAGKTRNIIAVEIGKEASTLRRELNPFDPGAKFGIESLVPYMNSTGSVLILNFLAERMGYRLERIDSAPDKSTISEEMCDTYQSIAAYHRCMSERRPIEEVHAALEAATNELEQDFVAYRNEFYGKKAV